MTRSPGSLVSSAESQAGSWDLRQIRRSGGGVIDLITDPAAVGRPADFGYRRHRRGAARGRRRQRDAGGAGRHALGRRRVAAVLQVVASEASSCRMLVLGVYRGADAYPRAEVAALLPAILCERTASLLTLHGLDAVEVEQLSAAAYHRPQEADLRAVRERAHPSVQTHRTVRARSTGSGLCTYATPTAVRGGASAGGSDRWSRGGVPLGRRLVVAGS